MTGWVITDVETVGADVDSVPSWCHVDVDTIASVCNESSDVSVDAGPSEEKCGASDRCDGNVGWCEEVESVAADVCCVIVVG